MRAPRSKAGIALCLVLGLAALAILPGAAVAQEQSAGSAAGVMKKVALDPTTYAPALIAYDATVRDWNTSQVFFEHGFGEQNARFTVSGRPGDPPISYGAGRRRILGDALMTLGASAALNAASYYAERTLERRHPEHGTLIRTLGWIERVSLASYLSYRLSIQHYRQTEYNQSLARSLGY